VTLNFQRSEFARITVTDAVTTAISDVTGKEAAKCNRYCGGGEMVRAKSFGVLGTGPKAMVTGNMNAYEQVT
jgi:hypothetical protein